MLIGALLTDQLVYAQENKTTVVKLLLNLLQGRTDKEERTSSSGPRCNFRPDFLITSGSDCRTKIQNLGVYGVAIVVDSLIVNLSYLFNSPYGAPFLLLGLEIIQQHTPLLTLLTPIPHHHTTAVDNLPRIALPVKYTQSSPFPQLFSVRHFDQRNFVFGAERDDEFLVCFFFATFVQDAHMCLAAVKGFGRFTKAPGETVVDEGKFEDT
jgi:hypothetical protein